MGSFRLGESMAALDFGFETERIILAIFLAKSGGGGHPPVPTPMVLPPLIEPMLVDLLCAFYISICSTQTVKHSSLFLEHFSAPCFDWKPPHWRCIPYVKEWQHALLVFEWIITNTVWKQKVFPYLPFLQRQCNNFWLDTILVNTGEHAINANSKWRRSWYDKADWRSSITLHVRYNPHWIQYNYFEFGVTLLKSKITFHLFSQAVRRCLNSTECANVTPRDCYDYHALQVIEDRKLIPIVLGIYNSCFSRTT